MRRTDRRGSNVVEFALLAPLYIAFMMGIFDYSWMTFQASTVTAATQEGCRLAAMADPGLADAQMTAIYNTANTNMKNSLRAKGLTCATGCSAVTSVTGTYPNRAIRCDLRMPFQSLTGFSPAPTHVKSRAVIRLEYQRK